MSVSEKYRTMVLELAEQLIEDGQLDSAVWALCLSELGGYGVIDWRALYDALKTSAGGEAECEGAFNK